MISLNGCLLSITSFYCHRKSAGITKRTLISINNYLISADIGWCHGSLPLKSRANMTYRPPSINIVCCHQMLSAITKRTLISCKGCLLLLNIVCCHQMSSVITKRTLISCKGCLLLLNIVCYHQMSSAITKRTMITYNSCLKSVDTAW